MSLRGDFRPFDPPEIVCFPCKVCRQEGQVMERPTFPDPVLPGRRVFFKVVCPCGIEGPMEVEPEHAVSAWNVKCGKIKAEGATPPLP